MTYADQAALFGSALALRGENVDLVEFGTTSRQVSFRKGESVLGMVKGKFTRLGGTNTAQAVRNHYKGHDRVVIITDEQASGVAPTTVVSDAVPVYTFNLVGYDRSHGASKANRYYFGGLTDASFGLIDLLERGRNGDFPF